MVECLSQIPRYFHVRRSLKFKQLQSKDSLNTGIWNDKNTQSVREYTISLYTNITVKNIPRPCHTLYLGFSQPNGKIVVIR